MTQYRLQPLRDGAWWLALFGTTAAVLALPALLLPVVPTRDVSEPVVLGNAEGWNIPLEMSCRPSTDALTKGWTCGDVLVQTMNVEGATDPDRTARRMLRAMAFLPPAHDAEILREGPARMIIDEPSRSVGVTLEGTGDNDDLTMAVVFTGPGEQMAPLSDVVWQEFTGRELPGIVREAIVSTSPGSGGGLPLPLEPQEVPV